MYNEFTPAGEMMKIVGDYFDLYEITTESGKLYFGDREMEIVRAVQDTLYFKLPTDAAVGAKVKQSFASPLAILKRQYCPLIATGVGPLLRYCPPPHPVNGSW